MIHSAAYRIGDYIRRRRHCRDCGSVKPGMSNVRPLRCGKRALKKKLMRGPGRKGKCVGATMRSRSGNCAAPSARPRKRRRKKRPADLRYPHARIRRRARTCASRRARSPPHRLCASLFRLRANGHCALGAFRHADGSLSRIPACRASIVRLHWRYARTCDHIERRRSSAQAPSSRRTARLLGVPSLCRGLPFPQCLQCDLLGSGRQHLAQFTVG